jgi:HEAT repeat protein
MTTRQIVSHLGGLVALIGLLALWYWNSTGARAVPGLTASLTDTQVKVRVAAAQGLGAVGVAAKPAVPELLNQALRDAVPYAASEAAKALVRIDLTAARQVMAAYLSALDETNVQTRREAAMVLGSLGPVAAPAVPALIHALKDRDDMVRDRAVRALGEIGVPAADVIPALSNALRDPMSHVRYAAASQFAFSMVPPADTTPALTQASNDEDKTVAFVAKTALARATREPKSSVPVLVIMLGQGSAAEYAMHHLAQLGPGAVEAVPALIPKLKDIRPLHRYLAVEALQAIGPSAARAIPSLVEALRDDDLVVRDSAVGALETIGTPEAKIAVAAYRSQVGTK